MSDLRTRRSMSDLKIGPPGPSSGWNPAAKPGEMSYQRSRGAGNEVRSQKK